MLTLQIEQNQMSSSIGGLKKYRHEEHSDKLQKM